MDKIISEHFSVTPEFELTPRPKDSYKIYVYTAGQKMGYKICPETDCEEVSPVGEPHTSIVDCSLRREPLSEEDGHPHKANLGRAKLGIQAT